MTVPSTDCYYPPEYQGGDLDRLVVFSSTVDAQDFWTDVHDCVQDQLAVLESDVRNLVPEVRATAGSTRGEHFLFFSYRVFSLPDDDVDPVVAGMTFTQAEQRVKVEADVSGEQTGELIMSPPNRIVTDSRNELLVAARAAAQELGHSAKDIAAALMDPSRKVE